MSSVVVQPGQTLYDIAVQHLGSMEGVYELARLNALDVTATLNAGQQLSLPGVRDKRVRRILQDYTPASTEGAGGSWQGWQAIRMPAAVRNNDITVQPRQTLFDIAVQYLGSIEGVYQLGKLNNLMLTDELEAGQKLKLPATIQPATALFFSEGRYVPAGEDEGVLDGIDYWMIAYEFEVQ